MKKKTLFLLSSLSLVSITGISIVSCQDTNKEDSKKDRAISKEFEYYYNKKDKTAAIMGFIDAGENLDLYYSENIDKIDIPEKVTKDNIEYTVNRINNRAFYYYNIQELNIPKTIKSIGKESFCNNKLQKVNIQEDSELEIIEDRAFYSNNLKEFNIPEKLKTIQEEVFGENEKIVINSYSKNKYVNYVGLYYHSKNHHHYDLNQEDPFINGAYTLNCLGTDVCLSYKLNDESNKNTILTGTIKSNIKDLIIPDKISLERKVYDEIIYTDYEVNNIEDYAFKSTKINIEKAILPDNLFNGESLKKSFNDSVQIIKYSDYFKK